MLTKGTTSIETIDRDTVNVGGHEVLCTWDANGAHINHAEFRRIRDAGHANWSNEEIYDLAYHAEVVQDQAYTKAYDIAVPDGDGWHILESIRVADDAAANSYAESNYADADWYVLDAAGNNING